VTHVREGQCDLRTGLDRTGAATSPIRSREAGARAWVFPANTFPVGRRAMENHARTIIQHDPNPVRALLNSLAGPQGARLPSLDASGCGQANQHDRNKANRPAQRQHSACFVGRGDRRRPRYVAPHDSQLTRNAPQGTAVSDTKREASSLPPALLPNGSELCCRSAEAPRGTCLR